MENPIQQISEILKNEDDFMVASHYNPDGDAIGSICALGWILKRLGKQVSLYNPSGLPDRYDYIPQPVNVQDTLPETMPKWTLVLDCGASPRMGDALLSRKDETNFINIDHHLGNDMFGKVNWVDPTHPAVGSMVATLAKELEEPLTDELAEAVYVAVATDTGFFTYGNTTPESLEMAAEMLREGLDISHLNMLITKQWSENRMRLWTEAMKGVELHKNKQVAITAITKEMFRKTGTTPEDTENIINFVRRLKTVRVAVAIREEGENTYKFSLRSYGDDNVQKIAAAFGGGGHKNAAGGTINASLDEAREQLITAIGENLGIK